MSDSVKQRSPDGEPMYPHIYPIPDEHIDLKEVWRVLFRHRLLVSAITVLTTVIALVLALTLTPIYRAETLLAPVMHDERGRLGLLSQQLGGLASIAGLNMGSGTGETDQALATLKSREFTYQFISDDRLLRVLFADSWDAEKDAWMDPESEPTLWDAYKIFNGSIRKVAADRDTGLVTLAIEWEDPVLAAEWANKLVDRVNKKLRGEAIVQSEKSIDFLENELEKTSILEVQQAVYGLIEAETKNRMLANTQEEYAFRVIDRAVVPEQKIRPKRKLIVIVGLALGLLLGFGAAFLRELWAANRPSLE